MGIGGLWREREKMGKEDLWESRKNGRRVGRETIETEITFQSKMSLNI